MGDYFAACEWQTESHVWIGELGNWKSLSEVVDNYNFPTWLLLFI